MVSAWGLKGWQRELLGDHKAAGTEPRVVSQPAPPAPAWLPTSQPRSVLLDLPLLKRHFPSKPCDPTTPQAAWLEEMGKDSVCSWEVVSSLSPGEIKKRDKDFGR